MPIIFYGNVEHGEYKLWGTYTSGLSLLRTYDVVEIKPGSYIEVLLVEIRNEYGNLVKRFKPFKKLSFNVGEYWYSPRNEWIPCISISDTTASEINIGKNYRICLILVKHDYKPILPFEIKPLDTEASKVVESLERLEILLLTTIVEHESLKKALSYITDSYLRLNENDVEGARTSLRNAMQILRDEVLPKIEVEEEAKDFKNNMRKMLSTMYSIMSYGGPHPGPAPKTTTEMMIKIVMELINYFAKIV